MNTLHLIVEHDRNRELLAEWLAETYAVTSGGDELTEETDMCIVDQRGFAKNRDRLEAWKTTHRPLFSPVVLVSEETPGEKLDPDAWETIDGLYVIDEIVSVPVEKTVLYRRLENLLERRTLSRRLATRYEQSEQRFSSLFHATPDPAFVVSEGTVTYVNDSFCDQMGVERCEVVDTPLSELSQFDETSIRQLLRTVDSAMTADETDDVDGTGETVVLSKPGGDAQSFEPNVNPMQLGGRSGVVVVLRDVTERLARERDLRRTEQRFEQIAANVNELIWLIDVDAGVVEYVSPGFDRMLGDDFVVRPDQSPSDFVSLVHPDDRAGVEATIERMLTDAVEGSVEDAYHFEFRVETRDYGTRWLEGDGYPIRDEDGDVHRYVGVFEDFTEYKERERLLERQNERLEEFAGIVSHDLRNPIQVLVARIDQLAHDGAVDEHLPAMERSVRRMEQLVDDLLSLAREGETATDPEPVSLEAVARNAWATVDAPAATLVVESDRSFVADESRFQQLLANLFRNAVEHGVSDKPSVADAPEDAVEHGSTSPDSQARQDAVEHGGDEVRVTVGTLADSSADGFYVADDGPGIPAEERDRVLERGYSTQDSGTGFGLDIVADIVEAHGWEMGVEESDSGGAKFVFTALEE